jgi:2-iminobutanoate/2-iminopropanoate deaminase
MSGQAASHRPVTGEGVPKPAGPYSPGVVHGGLVFCSGQLGTDPATGALAQGVEAQTRQALANLRAILEAAGSGMGNVVKTTVFLRDMADFPEMNWVYADAFGENRPARSTVAVAGIAQDALVEIEAIAHIP